MSSINWDSFKGEFVKWTDVDQLVEGTVTELRVGNYKGKTYPEVVIETAEGSRTVSANQASLKRQLADDPPAIGDTISIRYMGEGEKKGDQNPIKLFHVKVGHRSAGADGGGIKAEDLV